MRIRLMEGNRTTGIRARNCPAGAFLPDPHALSGSGRKQLKPVWRGDRYCGSHTNKVHCVFDFYDKNTMRRHGCDQSYGGLISMRSETGHSTVSEH